MNIAHLVLESMLRNVSQKFISAVSVILLSTVFVAQFSEPYINTGADITVKGKVVPLL
jgi:hypothetical protein